MSLNETAQWLVTYDIRKTPARTKVLRLVKRHGIPLQYSVFLVRATPARMRTLLLEITALINKTTDDIRAYRVPVNTEFHQMGRALLPGGVLLDAGLPESAPVKTATELPPLDGQGFILL
jgi:CRISPR-associated protein Cas2